MQKSGVFLLDREHEGNPSYLHNLEAKSIEQKELTPLKQAPLRIFAPCIEIASEIEVGPKFVQTNNYVPYINLSLRQKHTNAKNLIVWDSF